MAWKTIKELDFHPSRHLGYTVYFQSNHDGSALCETCVQTCTEDGEKFWEKSNFEDFSLKCDSCLEPIGCSYPPATLEEGVKRLTGTFGWCEDSAEQFTARWLEEQENNDDESN